MAGRVGVGHYTSVLKCLPTDFNQWIFYILTLLPLEDPAGYSQQGLPGVRGLKSLVPGPPQMYEGHGTSDSLTSSTGNRGSYTGLLTQMRTVLVSSFVFDLYSHSYRFPDPQTHFSLS